MPTRLLIDAGRVDRPICGACRRCRRQASTQIAAARTRSRSAVETRLHPYRTFRLRVPLTNVAPVRMYRPRLERDRVQGSETDCLAGRSSEARGASRYDVRSSRHRRLQEECRCPIFWYRVCSCLGNFACRALCPGNKVLPSRTGGTAPPGSPPLTQRPCGFVVAAVCELPVCGRARVWK